MYMHKNAIYTHTPHIHNAIQAPSQFPGSTNYARPKTHNWGKQGPKDKRITDTKVIDK